MYCHPSLLPSPPAINQSCHKWRQQETINTVKSILDPEEIRAMEIGLTRRHLRYGLLWRLGIISGLRVSDLLRLRKRDLLWPTLEVTEQKTGKHKSIAIDIAMRKALDWYFQNSWVQDDDFVFFRRFNRHDVPMTRQWARAVIASEAQKLAIKAIGAHSMRKIYACNIYRSTGSLEAVRQALNHGSTDTTLFYLRDVLVDAN